LIYYLFELGPRLQDAGFIFAPIGSAEAEGIKSVLIAPPILEDRFPLLCREVIPTGKATPGVSKRPMQARMNCLQRNLLLA
jgi:hypothetical protein